MCRTLFLCFLIIAGAVRAQTVLDTSSFQHFTVNDVLPTDNVYSAIQDTKGYMWFATDNGLVKYNGYTFKVYNTENGGLPANDIFEIHEDSRGRLWLYSFSYEFGYLQKGKYKSIHLKPGTRMITPFMLAEAGDLFYFVDYRDEEQSIVFVLDDVIARIPVAGKRESTTMWSVITAPSMQISLFTKDRKILYPDKNTGHLAERSHLYPEPFRYNYSHRSSVSPSNELFMSQIEGDNYYYFDIINAVYRRLNLQELGASPSEKLYTSSPYYYKGNYIGYSSFYTRTHVYNIDRDFNFMNRQAFSDIIPSSAQLVFRTKDRSGNFWYSTRKDGVWFRSVFYPFYASMKKERFLKEALYLGTVGLHNYWWDRPGSTLYELKGDEVVKKWKFENGVQMLSIAGNDSMSYITGSDGLYKYDHQNGKIINFSDQCYVGNTNDVGAGRSANNALALFSSRDAVQSGNLLYCNSHEGVRILTISNDTITVGLYHPDRYKGCFYDKKSNIRYSYSNRRILMQHLAGSKDVIVGEEQLGQLGVRNIDHLEVDRFGNILIVDDSELFIYDLAKNTATKVSTGFSLAGGTFRLSGDDLVVAARAGLSYSRILGPGKLSPFHTLPNAGMSKRDAIEELVIEPGGLIFLRTTKECRSLHIDTLKKYALQADNKEHFSLLALSPIEKRIDEGDTLRIAQTENSLQLDAINWYGKGSPRYSYRIDDNKDWETSLSGEVFLAVLTPGKYYRIQCRISDDIWRSKTFTFYVYRHPFWWQTARWRTIFWISGVILFLGLVLLIVLITRNYVARKSEKKRALTELELRAIHSQINPHFIFNTLSASLYFINKKRFDDAYDHVNKFSRLLRAYLKSSQDRFVMLEEEISMLRNYIELQQTRFEEKFEYSIEVDNKLPLNNIRIPSLLLQPLVENAINHGLFHKGGNGKLILTFRQGSDSTELICTIEDNGVGRAMAKKINEASSAKESYGTKLTNQLLDIFKDYEHLDISLEYIDKEAPETGTIVKLVLKNIKYVA